jgi:RHS repeat-associated protein
VNGRLESIAHVEGRTYYDGTESRLEFNLTDHLGNVRAVFSDLNENGQVDLSANTESSEMLMENNYYPFGMKMNGGWQEDKGRATNYRYNGKEFSEELGLYDYGARWYDPAIGRWNAVDPLASKMPGWSPYNYVMGNPISLTDPDGREPDGGIFSVSKNDDGSWNLTVSATVYVYGEQATEDFASSLQTQINEAWNTENSVLNFKGKDFSVNFAISVVALSTDDAASEADGNKDFSKNFLRIFESDPENVAGPSGSMFAGNSGMLDLNQNNKTGGTTASHEIGHMLGFRNFGEISDETHYYGKTSAGLLPMMDSGSPNPSSRVVTREDIAGLRLPSGIFGRTGRKSKNIGEALNNKVLRTNKDLKDYYKNN